LTYAGQLGCVRIALVSDTYTPQVNGVTTVLERMAKTLQREGHDCAVVAPAYPGGVGGGSGGDRELRVPSLPFPPYPAIRLSIPRVRLIRRFLQQFGPEVVHVATEGPLGVIGRRYALDRSVPLVTSSHTDFPQYCRHYGASSLEPLAWRFLTWFHRPAALTHTPGRAMRTSLLERGVSHTVIWGGAVDASHFNPGRRTPWFRRIHGLRDEAVLVLHVGRLAPEKDVPVLLEAWALVHEAVGAAVQFVIAGNGPLAPQVDAFGPWIRRLGFLDRHELANLYANADLCVLPSRTETCGLVALEAMASGLPVIAADQGGFRDSIASGVNGLLIRPGDARAFAAAILSLVVAAEPRRRYGEAARGVALGRDVERENAELLAQYASLINQATRGDLWRAA
jgi:glycosyltransferase involved in cell wall biosynthesis